MTHDEYMHLAIDQAVKAQQMGEVPVGAVLVDARFSGVDARSA